MKSQQYVPNRAAVFVFWVGLALLIVGIRRDHSWVLLASAALIFLGGGFLLAARKVYRDIHTKPGFRLEPGGVFFLLGLGQTMGRFVPDGAATDVQVWHPEHLKPMLSKTAAHRMVIKTDMPALVVKLRDFATLDVRGGWLARLIYRLVDRSVQRALGNEGGDNVFMELLSNSSGDLQAVADRLISPANSTTDSPT